MLNLQSTTSQRWLDQVDAHLEEVLIDHAHCEKKAAACAMHLMFAYIEDNALCRSLTEIVNEELEHFHLVVDLLDRRGIRFRRLPPSNYGRQLHEQIRKFEPQRAIDRLLVAGLIEARSCERFDLLRRFFRERDAELADFYNSLFESEARHHATYVRMAMHFGSEKDVRSRLEELARHEAEIIARGDEKPRMHS